MTEYLQLVLAIFLFVAGLAMAVAPLILWAITKNAKWLYALIITVPLGGAAIIYLLVNLKL